MSVRDVQFVGAVTEAGEPPPEPLPQIALAGRSNVGKSSLLNTLVGRKRIARVSKRPGKTQQINFFRVDGRFLLADLPGYGYARAPDEVREGWGPLMESYLEGSERLLGAALLVDSRHGPTGDDEQMVRYLSRIGLPTLFVLTKIDKLSRADRRERIRSARRELGAPEDQTVVTSAETGEGRKELLASLEALVEAAGRNGDGDVGKEGRSAVTP